MNEQHEKFMREAIDLSREKMNANQGGPFGAVVVKDGEIIARGFNQVTSKNDPTAHAEIVAIREACKVLNTFDLSGSVLYSSCEPCPMCLSAIYWAHIDSVYYANTKEDAAKIGFDDKFIYQELAKPKEQRKLKITQILRAEAQPVFQEWQNKKDKIKY